MRTGPFASAWRKWDRGEHYRHLLEADFTRLEKFHGNMSPLQFKRDEANDGRDGDLRTVQVTVLLGTDVPDLSDEFSLILGDAIHNYRSALDHLTWALVGMHRAKLTPARAKLVQFPTHNSGADFERFKHKRTPGVPDKPQRAFLKRYQPYRRGNGPEAIRWLRRLSDHDKHREVVPAVIAPQGVLLQATSFHPNVVIRRFEPLMTGPSRIKPGAPVAEMFVAVPLSMTPLQINVRVDAQFTLMPLLSRRAHPGGVLANISAVSSEIIAQCAEW